MGCYQSKMDNEEAVARCRDRHYFMKQAVSARNAFAAAHSSYATCLKNAGAALTDFAQGDVQNLQFPPPSSSAAQLSYDVPLPPPPVPDFPSALRRAITMPEIEFTRQDSDTVDTIMEEEEVEEKDGSGTSFNIEKEQEEVERRRFKKERKKECKQSESVSLVRVLTEVDHHFLMASDAAREVSKLLQATRLHYHSNFADTTGHVDYSARVMRVLTWDRSFRETPNMEEVKDDFDSEEHETLATVLDKLLVWEKKLYNQVKATESTKSEYQRKVVTLNKLKKRGTNSEALEKAKAALSHVDSMNIVDMQLLDSILSEINCLRDQQLYPKLVQLVDGMATMWGIMDTHHKQQFCAVTLLRSLDSQFPTETTEHHHARTYQLLIVVQEWQSQFEKLINNQKGYIKALYSWLELNLIPIEIDIKENVSSPMMRVQSPPIQSLLHPWYDHLEKLPDEVARTAIAKFAAVVDNIFHQQEEELVLKRKCEEMRKEHARKSRQFDRWELKYKKKKRLDDFDPNREEGDNDPDEVVREKRVLVELEKRLDEEKYAHERQCLQVRLKSFGCLKNHLPELFKALSNFSLECADMYRELRSISQKLSSGQSSS